MRLEQGDDENIGHVESDEDEAGEERAEKQVSDRDGFGGVVSHCELGLLVGVSDDIAQDDQHDGGGIICPRVPEAAMTPQERRWQ